MVSPSGVVAIESLPEDVDVIFRIPSTPDLENDELSQAAIKQGIPPGSFLFLDEAVLLPLTGDLLGKGAQAGQLAGQILKGVKPGNLPVETSGFSLSINLITSETIGIDVSGEILR